MRIRAWLATFDLSAEDVATIRARLADASVHVHREGDGLWHLIAQRRQATFRRIGQLAGGDTVWLVLAPSGARTYLANKLGAGRVELLRDAWLDPSTPAALGGVTRRAWLSARGFTADSTTDLPVPPHTIAGVPARVLGADYDLPPEE